MDSSSILELEHHDAKAFFLKHESYCNIDLPRYFSFTNLLQKISEELSDKSLLNFDRNTHNNANQRPDIANNEMVNHLIYANKDGKLSWRPLQIIHPLVYVDLVHKITKKDNWEKLKKHFKEYQNNPQIECLSIPVKSNSQLKDKAKQILKWWESVEQESICLSLEYEYVFDTDVADCYSSIYTHSIAWAIEGKDIAKKNHRLTLLGNSIDKKIQNCQYGQTNGIPQGSILMDFIAEMILGYIDILLSEELKNKGISEYKILRYRDDYKIFVKNHSDGENILKYLSEIMMSFGLKLNSSKTKGSQDIVTQSIKKDKLAWLKIANNTKNLQKKSLIIRQHSIEYPNSGSLNSALNEFDQAIEKENKQKIYLSLEELINSLNTSNNSIEKLSSNTKQVISIIADIAYCNPKVIPVCCSIISKLFTKLEDSEPIKRLVYNKLIRMPNSGFAQIWMQRMLKSDLNNFNFSEKMCNLYKGEISLWNNDWIICSNMLSILKDTPVFQQDEFSQLSNTMSNDEVYIFDY